MIPAATLALLCMIAVCGGSSFSFYAAGWLAHVALLLLFPKNSSAAKTVGLIGLPALFCRALLAAKYPIAADQPVVAALIPLFFDLATLGWILALLHRRALPLRWSILYALSPVILHAYSARGYPDAGFSFFLMGAIFYYDRRQWARMYLLAGLSIVFSAVAAAAVPFLFRRENLRCSWILVPTAGILWLIHLRLFDLHQITGQFPAPDLRLPGSIHALVNTFSGDPFISGAVSCILLGTVLLYGFLYFHPLKNPRHGNDPVSGCFFAVGACLLFSENIHWGNLAWIVPFLCFRPSVSWMLLGLTFGLALGWSPASDSAPLAPLWAASMFWGPFWILFLNDLYLSRQRKNAPVDCEDPETVSVVIPAVDEAQRIGACIEAAKMHEAVKEVIVVDGGSTDRTMEEATAHGAIALRLGPGQRRGRGAQIHAGIRSSNGDIVLVVHADVRISARIVQDILLLMKRQPMFAGGAVGSVFDSKGFRYRLIEAANDFRMACLGIGFGDQVQFFRRRPVVEEDLFPDIPLMEDVEFGIRLHRMGRQAFLFGEARVSPRRWEQKGAAHAVTVIRLFGTYMFQRIWKTPDTEAMYRRYYRRSAVAPVSKTSGRIPA
jgi:hypothetical protein